jgi:hypothetical protein
VFYIIEGQFRFTVAGQEHVGAPGDTLVAAKGTPHTYRVESERGRWLTITSHRDFEEFVRAMARKADAQELPPFGAAPTPEQIAVLTATAKQFGIEIVGPPMQGV